MMPPDEAVIVIVPSAPAVCVALTTPADTVAMVVLLEVHVATLVIGTVPLHVSALAAKVAVAWLFVIVPLEGVIVIF